MKKELKNPMFVMQGFPQTIISVRDAKGRNNALAVGYITNVNMNPPMMLIGIAPSRYSHHMIKENPCFVINLPEKNYRKEYGFLGSVSGADVDKFETLEIRWEDAERVNAPLLTDCPVNIECSVVDSNTLLYHELFVGKIEKVHVDEKYLDKNGRILWDKMDLIGVWA